MSAKLYPLSVSLPLYLAQSIIEGVIAEGEKRTLSPLTVVVLDAGANLVTMARQDGSGVMRQQIAQGKAHAALGFGRASRITAEHTKDRHGLQASLASASDGHFIAVAGGLLILNSNDEAIGAVGVSGDSADEDENAAKAGLRAAGL